MSSTRRWNLAFAVALLVLGGTAGLLFRSQAVPLAPAIPLPSFPFDLEGWIGRPADPESSPFRLPDADDELVRVYRDGLGHSVGLYIGYFRAQDSRKKLVDFRSRDLARGAEHIEVPDGAASWRLGRTHLAREGRHWVVYYWFDIDGRIVPSRSMAKLYLLANALWRWRSNGALVLIFHDGNTPRGAPTPSLRETALLHALISAVRSHLSTQSRP